MEFNGYSKKNFIDKWSSQYDVEQFSLPAVTDDFISMQYGFFVCFICPAWCYKLQQSIVVTLLVKYMQTIGSAATHCAGIVAPRCYAERVIAMASRLSVCL